MSFSFFLSFCSANKRNERGRERDLVCEMLPWTRKQLGAAWNEANRWSWFQGGRLARISTKGREEKSTYSFYLDSPRISRAVSYTLELNSTAVVAECAARVCGFLWWNDRRRRRGEITRQRQQHASPLTTVNDKQQQDHTRALFLFTFPIGRELIKCGRSLRRTAVAVWNIRLPTSISGGMVPPPPVLSLI